MGVELPGGPLPRGVSGESIAALSERLSLVPGLPLPPSLVREKGEGEQLAREAREEYLAELLARDPGVFLERYVGLLSDEELHAFEGLKDDYIVAWHLRQHQKNVRARSSSSNLGSGPNATVRNRRYAFLMRLQKDGEYFSEDSMRLRAPALYLEYMGDARLEGSRQLAGLGIVGQDVDPLSGDDQGLGAPLAVTSRQDRNAAGLVGQLDSAEARGKCREGDGGGVLGVVEGNKATEAQVEPHLGEERSPRLLAAARAEATRIQLQRRTSEGATDATALGDRQPCGHAGAETSAVPQDSFAWGPAGSPHSAPPRPYSSGRWGECSGLAAVPGSQRAFSPSGSAQSRLAELQRSMEERFMAGEDGEHVDYTAIDGDVSLDDDWLMEAGRDAEEKYFEED